jgi:hypothetical protein
MPVVVNGRNQASAPIDMAREVSVPGLAVKPNMPFPRRQANALLISPRKLGTPNGPASVEIASLFSVHAEKRILSSNCGRSKTS